MAWAIDEPLATCTRVCWSQVLQAANEGLGLFLSHHPALLPRISASIW
jgi:hypothetical protein